MERRKASSRNSSAEQPAYATAGEQVFGDNADDILAEKIKEHTRENASGPSEGKDEKKAPRKVSRKTEVIGLTIVAVIAGAVLLLLRAFFKVSGRKGKR